MSEAPKEGSLSRSEFWMRVAGGAFALWSFMIPIGVIMIRSSIDSLARPGEIALKQVDELKTAMTAMTLANATKSAVIEDRQNRVIYVLDLATKKQDEFDTRLSTIEQRLARR